MVEIFARWADDFVVNSTSTPQAQLTCDLVWVKLDLGLAATPGPLGELVIGFVGAWFIGLKGMHYVL